MKLIAIFTRVMFLSTKLFNNDQKFCHQFAIWWQKFAQSFLLKKEGERPFYAQKGRILTLNMSGMGPARWTDLFQSQLAVQFQKGRCRRQCRNFEESKWTNIQTRGSAANVYFLFLLDDFPDCLLGNIAVLLYVLISFGKGPSLEKRL